MKTHLPAPAEPVLWAACSFALTGAHSGLTPLAPAVQRRAPGFIRLVGTDPTTPRLPYLARRVARKIGRLLGNKPPFPAIQKQAPFYSEMGWALERRIRGLMRRSPPRALFFESLDDQFFTLSQDRSAWADVRFLGTCHQPPSWWSRHAPGARHFQALDHLVVVSTEARSYWQERLGAEKVVFIPHGADVDFFVPGTPRPPADGPLLVIFCGNWFRDFETLAAVVHLADARRLAVHFHLVIPAAARRAESLSGIAQSPRVSWHAGLSDDGLRALYQQSDLMLQTLRDCTANNAILEGMACGLPLVVTDIGGARDYARPEFTDFVPPRDPAAALAAIDQWLGRRGELPARGRLARGHVTTHLSWDAMAQRYVALIRETIGAGA